jgi:hypothetical protein
LNGKNKLKLNGSDRPNWKDNVNWKLSAKNVKKNNVKLMK